MTRKWVSWILVLCLAATLLAPALAEEDLPDVEIWHTITGTTRGIEKDGVMYSFYKDLLGVGIVEPYVEWNGGSTYQEQLNLRISAGEAPDMFLPVNGMEADLIRYGALLDLTDLLPEKAPHLWEIVPQEVWDIMRDYDPTGNGRIYVIPNIVNFAREGGMIRKDWLDKLGLNMPKTQEEFVEVLRAFKDGDPNGNGIADEIPTGGRAEARWMDHLFAMYGVAMYEGFPDWDVYDGEVTYSAVTQNMRDALAFISGLYAEGLLDPETLLNDKAGWEGKVNSDRVGIFFHWLTVSYYYANQLMLGTGVEGDWAYLPCISAPGYEGFYTQKQLGQLWMACFNTTDEKKIDAMMKVLDGFANPDNWDRLGEGPEGYLWNYDEEGVKRPIEDASNLEMPFSYPSSVFATKENSEKDMDEMIVQALDEASVRALERCKENIELAEGKPIAGDGLPNSIYEDYPDILNRTLYVEYASKIIAGEYPIEKFDEFVERWYASGGEVVTQRAREWYQGIKQ
ncbi:MAG: extracellular solute-binding protein [Clostridia bacterium]|nr:extracellular solute-binding protein [Clostridia bacterium]